MNYSEKLKDPRWQKKRLQILERDNWTCQSCYDTKSTLAIHHRRYHPDYEPWDYQDDELVTLCELCHEYERVLRPDVESDILTVLRLNFSYDALSELFIKGFAGMVKVHSDEVVASALAWVIKDSVAQKDLIKRYFEMIGDSD